MKTPQHVGAVWEDVLRELLITAQVPVMYLCNWLPSMYSMQTYSMQIPSIARYLHSSVEKESDM